MTSSYDWEESSDTAFGLDEYEHKLLIERTKRRRELDELEDMWVSGEDAVEFLREVKAVSRRMAGTIEDYNSLLEDLAINQEILDAIENRAFAIENLEPDPPSLLERLAMLNQAKGKFSKTVLNWGSRYVPPGEAYKQTVEIGALALLASKAVR